MRKLAPLLLVCVIDVLGFGILIPLIPYMADRFGTPPSLITPILGTYSLCQLISSPWWGRLSDRFGRRPILMASLAGACLSYLMLAFTDSIGWLIVSRVLAGFMAGNLAAAFAYASDVSSSEDRVKALGMVGASIGVGFMLGPAIGGILSGEDEHAANFTVPAIASSLLALCAIALVYKVLPESHPPERRTPRGESGRAVHPWRLLAQRPGLRLIAAAALLVTFSQSIVESIFAIWAMNAFGFGPRTVGMTLFCLAAIAVAMQAGFVRVLTPILGEAWLGSIGVASFVAGLYVIATASGLATTLAGLVLCGIGGGAFNPTAAALASRQSLPGDRGSVMGVYQSASSLARVIAPFISGTLYMTIAPGAPFILGICVTLPAVWLVWRARDRPASKQPAIT